MVLNDATRANPDQTRTDKNNGSVLSNQEKEKNTTHPTEAKETITQPKSVALSNYSSNIHEKGIDQEDVFNLQPVEQKNTNPKAREFIRLATFNSSNIPTGTYHWYKTSDAYKYYITMKITGYSTDINEQQMCVYITCSTTYTLCIFDYDIVLFYYL